MMRNDWQNMYTAATDVMNSGQYNLNTPYDVIFTDEGENSSESVFELQCASTAALPASDKIGSQSAKYKVYAVPANGTSAGDGTWEPS